MKFPSIRLLLSKSLKNDSIINSANDASKKGNGKVLLSCGGMGAATHAPLSLTNPLGH